MSLVLGLMIVVDGAMILRLRAGAYDLAHADSLARSLAGKRAPVPPPDGFTVSGTKIGVLPGRQAGWAVRYATKRCGYCQQDNATWNRLAAELQRLGYKVINVVPSAKDGYPDDAAPRGAPQEAYVNMEWIRRFRLTVTPTLLIFGPDHRLIWSRQGTLHLADPELAVRVIEQTAARRSE